MRPSIDCVLSSGWDGSSSGLEAADRLTRHGLGLMSNRRFWCFGESAGCLIHLIRLALLATDVVHIIGPHDYLRSIRLTTAVLVPCLVSACHFLNLQPHFLLLNFRPTYLSYRENVVRLSYLLEQFSESRFRYSRMPGLLKKALCARRNKAHLILLLCNEDLHNRLELAFRLILTVSGRTPSHQERAHRTLPVAA